MTEESVKMRAYRTLRPLSTFRSAEHEPNPPYMSGVPVAEDDELLGAYENTKNERRDSVVFTVKGVYADRNGVWVFTPYAGMSRVMVPSGDKHQTDSITVELVDGSRTSFPITGGDEKLRDVFEVSRYFDRVIAKTWM